MTKLFGEKTFLGHIGYTCDRCGRTDTVENGGDMEVREYLHYEDTCGYGATYSPGVIPYADGDRISISLCQHCKFQVLGPWMKVEEDDD